MKSFSNMLSGFEANLFHPFQIVFWGQKWTYRVDLCTSSAFVELERFVLTMIKKEDLKPDMKKIFYLCVNPEYVSLLWKEHSKSRVIECPKKQQILRRQNSME